MKNCRLRIGALLFAGAAVSLFAQSPEFEVASIRLNTSWPVMGIGPGIKGGLFTGQAIVLRNLIANAYGLAADRVIGPDWLDKDRYDIAARSPMPRLADMLSNVAGKPVVDKTDLTGTFAIALQIGTTIPSEASTPDPGDDAPDVFRAIQEQLGLKLRPAKGALDVLVIDGIERTPTAN